jgi:hypothetical protein
MKVNVLEQCCKTSFLCSQGIVVALCVTCDCGVLRLYTRSLRKGSGKRRGSKTGTTWGRKGRRKGLGGAQHYPKKVSKSTSLQLLTWDPTPDTVWSSTLTPRVVSGGTMEESAGSALAHEMAATLIVAWNGRTNVKLFSNTFHHRNAFGNVIRREIWWRISIGEPIESDWRK